MSHSQTVDLLSYDKLNINYMNHILGFSDFRVTNCSSFVTNLPHSKSQE